MSTEAIVSELMELIQSQISGSAGESLSEKEERALAIGRRAAELAMSEMISVDPAEPLCVTCECGGIAMSKESRRRSMVTWLELMYQSQEVPLREVRQMDRAARLEKLG